MKLRENIYFKTRKGPLYFKRKLKSVTIPTAEGMRAGCCFSDLHEVEWWSHCGMCVDVVNSQ